MKRYVIVILFTLVFGSLNAQDKSEQIMQHYLQETGVPITNNNQVKLLFSGEEKFDDLFNAIKQAKHHIHLEYFNFRNDSIAGVLFKHLSDKVKEGVEVRALFDAFGNSSNNRPLRNKHLEQIRKQGIQIQKFDPLKFPWLNHVLSRDHRKIVIIDGKIGYLGGMNVADYYIHGLPEVGEWRDVHMRIEGDAVHTLQKIFLDVWNKNSKENIDGPEYYPYIANIPDSLRRPIAIVDRKPRKTPKAMRRAYVKAIDAAEKNIQIINPYFVPTTSIRKALKRALKKGVEVEIMLPLKSDIVLTPEASFHVGNKLRKKGAKVYLFKDGFHHSKVMMVDSTFCTVGTSNLNSRSLRYDYETNAFIFSPITTHQLNDMFAIDKESSIPLTKEYWKQRSAWKKFVGWFGNLLTPFI